MLYIKMHNVRSEENYAADLEALNEPECEALHFDTKCGRIRCWNRKLF